MKIKDYINLTEDEQKDYWNDLFIEIEYQEGKEEECCEICSSSGDKFENLRFCKRFHFFTPKNKKCNKYEKL